MSVTGWELTAKFHHGNTSLALCPHYYKIIEFWLDLEVSLGTAIFSKPQIPNFPPEQRRVISLSSSEVWSLLIQHSALVGISSPQPQLCPSGQSHSQMVAKAGEKEPQRVCHGTVAPRAYGLEDSQEFHGTLHVSGDPGIHSGAEPKKEKERQRNIISLGNPHSKCKYVVNVSEVRLIFKSYVSTPINKQTNKQNKTKPWRMRAHSHKRHAARDLLSLIINKWALR